MSQLKDMYRTVVRDAFPETIGVDFGAARLVYRRRVWDIGGEKKGLRYGENPDQPAAMYELAEGEPSVGGITYKGAGRGLVSALREKHMIQAGKHPGKTNLTDVDNGINILQYLTQRPAALILKHNNPCGAAWSDRGIADALDKAYWGDRIAAFGGAVALNRPVDKAAAERIDSAYFEVLAAPDFEEGTLDILTKKKNLRIVHIPGLAALETFAGLPFLDITSLSDGGLILQQSFVNRIRAVEDFIPATAEKDGIMVSARKPTAGEADDLLFAWAVESGVSSNSVIFARNGATVAIGTGEQDRVGCVEVAVHKAYVKYKDMLVHKASGLSLYEVEARGESDASMKELLEQANAQTSARRGGLAGSVLVSDGFFPFRDGVDAAMRHGITAIAQPGGSLRDHEVIMAVNESTPQVAMVFTGQRSFRH
ncbi:MAG: IMP cyclohydrolase [Desulfovibrio sp.]|jgi:phosphoribosylaminoimidazolecarboxamide formyltransferase/IMP cyclohydrolase|nr:IMP cyclohydrolase [Desulfovibrio sp.]